MTLQFLALEQWLNTNRWLIIRQATKACTGDFPGADAVSNTIIEAISPAGMMWTFTGENGLVQSWKNEFSADVEVQQ